MKKFVASLLAVTLVFSSSLFAVANSNIRNVTTNNTMENTIKFMDANNQEVVFEKIAESQENALYVDKKTANIRIQSKITDEFFETKKFFETSANADIANAQKSDLLVHYLENANIGSPKTFDSYSLAVAKEDGVTYETIENGIRINYNIGQKKLTENDLPLHISKENFEKKILDKISSQEEKTLKDVYRFSRDSYVRNQGKMSDLQIKKILNIIFEKGEYTQKDWEEDNKKYNVIIKDEQPFFKISIEFTLDKDDLVVNVPVEKIEYNTEFPIQSITVLPYFMSGTTQDEGYMFVPDGSGAIINFNNNKSYEYRFETQMYGGNIIKNTTKYKNQENSTLPVIGVKKNDTAMIGIVEKGSGLGSIIANVSGQVDEFNKVYCDFELVNYESIPVVGNATLEVGKISTDKYKGNLTLRYRTLQQDKANYTGMAKAYSEYLQETGVLNLKQSADKSPFFVELLGAIPKKKFFLGIPYESSEALTTFSQAEKIMKSLQSSGISNIKLEYNGWANGGINHYSIKNLKVESVLGGKKGLEQLNKFSNENGIELFPLLNFTKTYTTKNISRTNDVARQLSGEPAELYQFNPVTYLPMFNKKPIFVISPYYIGKYTDDFIKSYNKLNIGNISISDLDSRIIPDYRGGKEVNTENSMPYWDEALNKVNQNYKTMLSNPNANAFKDADYIVDLPTFSNNYNITDYSIPFIQMVLEGSVDYSVKSINTRDFDGIEKNILKAMESKSGLKFTFTNANESIFLNTDFNYYFSTEFKKWENKIGAIYSKYNEFYNKVKDTQIKMHTNISNNVVKVEYENGLTLYINYSNSPVEVDGININPIDSVIK